MSEVLYLRCLCCRDVTGDILVHDPGWPLIDGNKRKVGVQRDVILIKEKNVMNLCPKAHFLRLAKSGLYKHLHYEHTEFVPLKYVIHRFICVKITYTEVINSPPAAPTSAPNPTIPAENKQPAVQHNALILFMKKQAELQIAAEKEKYKRLIMQNAQLIIGNFLLATAARNLSRGGAPQ